MSFRDQNRQRQKDPGDRDEDGDGEQNISDRKCLVEDFEDAPAKRLIRIDQELAVTAELVAESVTDCFRSLAFLQIDGDAIDPIVVPEAGEILRAHVNDPLVARVIVKNRGDPKRVDPVGCRELDRFAFVEVVPPGKAFRNEDAGFLAKPAHERAAVASQELEMALLAAANDGKGDVALSHRQIDFAKGIDGLDRWVTGKELQSRWRHEGIGADFIRSRRDEEIGDQGIIDPRLDGFPEREHHHTHAHGHRYRERQRRDGDGISEQSAREIGRGQLGFDARSSPVRTD